MATNFPTNIDTFTDQTSSDLITSAKWNNLQDSIEALEVKVGADNSAVTTSHDYKLAELATTLGAITSAADVADFEKLHDIIEMSGKDWVDVRGYGDSISTALGVIGEARATLWIPSGISLSEDTTIPANVGLKIQYPGSITLGDYSLTINGPFEGSPGCFVCNGMGSVTFGIGSVDAMRPEWWGAQGDGVTDDAEAIQKAICAAEASTPRIVSFRPVLYNVSKTLEIKKSSVTLVGAGNMWGAASFTPLYMSGTQLRYTSDDGGTLLKVYDPDAIRYHFTAMNIRLGASAGLEQKPTLLHIESQSEFTLKNIGFMSGAEKALILSDFTLGFVSDFYFSANTYHIYIQESATPKFSSSGGCHFTNGNIWDASEASIYCSATHTNNMHFSNTWFERAKYFIQVEALGSIVLSNWTFTECDTFQDTVYGVASRDGWLLNVVAEQNTASMCRIVTWKFNSCRIDASSDITGAAVIFTKGSNTSVNSYIDGIQFNSCSIGGNSSWAIISSDTTSTSAVYNFSTLWSGISKVGGSAKWAAIEIVNRQYKITGSRPIVLPSATEINSEVPGQIYYDSTFGYLKYTDETGTRNILKPAAVVPYSTASDITTLKNDFNALLTSLRTAGIVASG